MLINLRNAMMASKRLPYDAELEYLESTGTQWIDTGVAFSDSSRTYKWDITAQSVNKSSGNYKWFCGYFSGYPHCCGTYNDTTDASRAFYPTGKYYANGVEISPPIAATDKKYDVVENIYSVNGLGVSDTLTIFTRRDTRYGTVSASGPLRVYACKLYDNGTLVRDFIPVRKGTVGYLYDRVSKRLFGNAGTGDFVLGPDVVPVEYIESHGTEWIDTGVVGDNDCGVEMEVCTLGNDDRACFGSRGETTDSRFFIGFSITNRLGLYLGWNTRFDYTSATPNRFYRASMNFEGDRAIRVDGTQVTSIASVLTSQSNRKSLLFGANLGGSNSLFTGRIKYCKMTSGVTLVRDFIPIRVGTGSTWEGAMMDVLTRRVYRNAGTGAFTWGNDLRYPIPSE